MSPPRFLAWQGRDEDVTEDVAGRQLPTESPITNAANDGPPAELSLMKESEDLTLQTTVRKSADCRLQSIVETRPKKMAKMGSGWSSLGRTDRANREAGSRDIPPGDKKKQRQPHETRREKSLNSIESPVPSVLIHSSSSEDDPANANCNCAAAPASTWSRLHEQVRT